MPLHKDLPLGILSLLGLQELLLQMRIRYPYPKVSVSEHSENVHSENFLNEGRCSYFMAKLSLYYCRSDYNIQVPDNAKISE